MGDPKKQKKKYHKPLMIWNEELIAKQKDLTKNYGLKNKREIWKIDSELKSLHDQAKKLTAQKTPQAEKESIQLIKRLAVLNLIPGNAKLEDILSLTAKDLMERRLQTLVLKRGLAKTIRQARQFITHNHIAIGDQTINVPSYKVKAEEENLIRFNPKSLLSQESHPERILDKEAQEKEKKVKEEILEKKPKKEKTETDKVLSTPEEKVEQEEKLIEAVPEEKITHKEK